MLACTGDRIASPFPRKNRGERSGNGRSKKLDRSIIPSDLAKIGNQRAYSLRRYLHFKSVFTGQINDIYQSSSQAFACAFSFDPFSPLEDHHARCTRLPGSSNFNDSYRCTRSVSWYNSVISYKFRWIRRPTHSNRF